MRRTNYSIDRDRGTEVPSLIGGGACQFAHYRQKTGWELVPKIAELKAGELAH